ncbi:hypothetical protein D5S18_26930 [Nocardia panacis]|uniref:AMP-dependent synthetase n=1 Tax=Nocardia panacis TaxID=2340916 RepID=A0A3A4K826_9NOCA|nr:AMP-binding protein [Nocardia panacis]RJO70827.1 hypothetical protein D5S18_26930 [Nocardia panacis]
MPLNIENLAGLARDAAQAHGERIVLETAAGERLSFRALAERTAGIAAGLAESGIGAGDVIALALDGGSPLLLHILAAADLGAAALPINPTLTDVELGHILGLVDPDLLVVSADFARAHAGLLHDKPVRLLDHPVGIPANSLGARPMSELRVRFGLTSGSTGVPKAVAKTQRQWLLDGLAMAAALDLRPWDRVLSSQPLYYGDPFMLLLACLSAGATCVYLERFRSQDFFEQVRAHRITKFVTIGSMPAMLVNTPPSPADRAHGAEAAWSVGVPRGRHAELERRFGIAWRELYGLSETGLVLAQGIRSEREVGAGWLGEPPPGVRLRLVDPAGEVVTGDGEGLLEVRGPSVVREYHNRPEATAETIRDGWFNTGDVLERRGDRYRYLRRRKDIVRRSGENLSCQEIEAALRDSDQVIDAAVLPRPDEIRGEEVWAFVQPVHAPVDTAAAHALAERIAEQAALRLGPRKLPRFLTFVDAFERTPSERIIKRHLVEQAERWPTVDRGERRSHRG